MIGLQDKIWSLKFSLLAFRAPRKTIMELSELLAIGLEIGWCLEQYSTWITELEEPLTTSMAYDLDLAYESIPSYDPEQAGISTQVIDTLTSRKRRWFLSYLAVEEEELFFGRANHASTQQELASRSAPLIRSPIAYFLFSKNSSLPQVIILSCRSK